MSYAERRISFIVLKADCFTDYDSNFFEVKENRALFLNKVKSEILNIKVPASTDFYKREQRYDTVFNYAAYAEASLKGLRKKVDLLQAKATISEDDADYLSTMRLYLDCSAYFNDSWYVLPEIKFSENFYRQFFQSKEKKLFEHYLYDGDTTSEFRLSIANKYPGKYDYIPPPHLIDKAFATDLLALLKTNDDNISDFLIQEAKFFKEILEGVVNNKYVLIIKTYM